jgi:glycine cleavage system H protein
MFKYQDSHEWAKADGKVVTVGISEFAAEHLGDVIFVELPAVGKVLTKGGKLCDLESVKAVAEVFSPVSGKVIAVNSELEANAGLINEAAQAGGWIAKIEAGNLLELDSLMDEEAYQKFLATQH